MYHSTTSRTLLVGILGIQLMAAHTADAASITVTHTATATYAPANGAPTTTDTATQTATGFTMPDDIAVGAGSATSGFSALANLNGDGSLAVRGLLLGAGTVSTTVSIVIDIVPTLLATLADGSEIYESLDTSILAIVDGGYIEMLDSANASISFDYLLQGGLVDPTSDTYYSVPSALGAGSQASGEISYDAAQNRTTTIDDIGFVNLATGVIIPPLGLTEENGGSRINIPVSFSRAPGSVGGLNAPDTYRITYEVSIQATSSRDGFTEGAAFAFSDPLRLGSGDPAVSFDFSPMDVAPVPLPAGLPILATGLFALGIVRGKRRWRSQNA